MKAEKIFKNKQSGVAVIIVLGLLALLMVLGVAFSVSMRVERTGAANYASAVRTRQMVWAGLARAISAIEQTTDIYPDGNYLVSGSSVWNTPGDGVFLLTGSATNYVPGICLPTNNVESSWIPLGGTGDSRAGYSAHIVLNLSDMLDANYVGGAPREGGIDASELVLVPDILSSAEFDDLIAERPFETLTEIPPSIPSDYFETFSLYRNDTNQESAVYMGTNVVEIGDNEDDILEAIRNILGVANLVQEEVWFDYFLDYVDTTTVPRSPDGPNAKPVPLLNEVAPGVVGLQPTLTLTGLEGEMAVEVWNPSVTNYPGTQYKIIGSLATIVTITDDVTSFGPYIYTNSISDPRRPRTFELEPGRLRIHTFPIFDDNWPAVDLSTNNPQVNINIKIQSLEVIEESSGRVADSASNLDFEFNHVGAYAVGPVAFQEESWQTIDPRLNWIQMGWTNAPATITERGGVLNQGQEEGGVMRRTYASERGILFSPLELGHLLCLGRATGGRGDREGYTEWAPWREFKLTGPSRHKLLEHLKTRQTDFMRGLVHANSLDTLLLASAFKDLPFPAPDADTEAADYLVLNNSTNLFTSISDVLDLDWQGDLSGTLSFNDVEWDSLVACSMGLLGVRQNLFLVVVAASPASDGMGKDNQNQVGFRARQRAIALVWRDPIPNAQDLHECFIRMFKWLN